MAGFVRTPEQIEKDHRAAELRSRGMTYLEVGAVFGVTRQGAFDMVKRAIAEIPTEATVELKALERAKLDYAERELFSIVASVHPMVTMSGKVVTIREVGDDGEVVEVVVEDVTPRIRAIEALLRVQQRRARLLGLDAPTQVQLDAVVVDGSAVEVAVAELERLFEQNHSQPGLLVAGDGAA